MTSRNGSSSASGEPGSRTAPAVATLDGASAVQLPPGGSMAQLRDRRRVLAERVAELTWDLGGLTYEMAIRDHYRLDVLARRAAELQAADAELAEVQRLLATADAGISGECRSCGAVHSRGAAYCWHCGAPLLEESRPSALHHPSR
jgi:hypothetical protein